MQTNFIQKLGVIFLALFLLSVPFTTQAQQGMTLARVTVDLWPEFDRPTMLVIYHITLPTPVSLPAAMNLRIPLTVGVPNAVAAKSADGALLNIPFKQESDGIWSRLNFQATSRDVQIEYYDPGLQINGDRRHFEYTWPGDYAVEAFDIQIQQPTGASEMHFKPGTVSARQGADNLKYYEMNVGSLTGGQQFQITVDYQKSTDELSASNVPVEPSSPLDELDSGIASLPNLPWYLGGVGLLLIVGGLIWYWRTGRQQAHPRRDLHRRNKPTESQAAESATGGSVYCHQCGNRAAVGDRFCRTCGTELRAN